MSMREYPISGFGLELNDLKVDYEKLKQEYINMETNPIEKENLENMSVDDFKEDQTYLIDYISIAGDGFIDYGFSESTEYVLIYSGLPFQFKNSEIFNLKNKEEVAEYMYEKLKNITCLSKEAFISKTDFIEDTYCG